MSSNDPKGLQAVVDELKLINGILDRLCRLRESNHIMETVISELIKLTDADEGVISLVAPLGEEVLQTVVRGSAGNEETIPYKVSSLISGWTLRNRRMLKIDDLDNDKQVPGLSSEGGAYKSILCYPLMVRDEIVGITSLIRHAGKEPFTDDQARVAGILNAQAAQLLNHARMREELAEKTRLLEMSQRKLKDENARLRLEIDSKFAFENIIGKSAAMKRVMALASKFSANDGPVLITGETGTGKELIARAIHHNSPRSKRPFVVKNCGVKTETLLESELFGHVKGAFTGADRDKPGLFKEADGGTVFLDEIGDAPPSTQVAILRVIQTGEIRPVGASKAQTVNVRVISATNKNLKAEIETGSFREDLYYRLATLVIELPPLRDRRDDIPLLVHATLNRLRIKLGRENLAIAPEAMDALVKYDWPGNVRQLENELERAAVVCDADGRIAVGNLSRDVSVATYSASRPPGGPLREIVAQVEQDAIRTALADHAGNIVQTAKALHLSRRGLKQKMERYGITASQERP